LRYKVFLDTSALIAGSICLSSAAIGFEIKDVFYEEAMQLISVIRKNINKRIGITTSGVEEEAYNVMSSAIERKLKQKINDRAKVFELISIAVNSCESRLRDILSYVVREPVNPDESAKLYIQVNSMYDDLIVTALNLPRPAHLQTEVVPKFLNKSQMFGIYKTQDECLHAQLTNLIHNEVENTDKMHLAQAAYLCKLYKETETKITMYLASTDYHFVPIRYKGYISAQVTQKIEEKFGIIADKPDEIFKILQANIG
jgi:hypothetical protein